MIHAHADAILDLLRAVDGLTVYPEAEPGDSGTLVPSGADPPYVAVHIVVDRPIGPTLDMRSSRVVARAYCHCVGGNAVAARAVAQRVSGALLDVRPAIAGRSVFPIRHEASSGPPASDESTGQLRVDLTDVYRLETLPG